ncbi:hypothetical protein KXT90_25095, partial [Salmonella enterica subsp. enterica serovar Weltevreden]|nr:hypothetical protein [Salmonella enterica subsp. enterica serovar Weltevreden]
GAGDQGRGLGRGAGRVEDNRRTAVEKRGHAPPLTPQGRFHQRRTSQGVIPGRSGAKNPDPTGGA